jgi:hypothetical protein
MRAREREGGCGTVRGEEATHSTLSPLADDTGTHVLAGRSGGLGKVGWIGGLEHRSMRRSLV